MQKVMLCFRAWEDWAIYPGDFLFQLQTSFLGIANEPLNEDGDPLFSDDIDGAALDDELTSRLPSNEMTTLGSDVEALEATPLVQYDGDAADLDGSPLVEHEDEDDATEMFPLLVVICIYPSKSNAIFFIPIFNPYL
ncbi:unnamed protein product [Protopolystoma xenopodis]|uniref:CID domain-containing protein n=1 Tax=Protopolystoma xenopodis TaxID=117903 RepID=A0A3S5C888_9PLAT|nr:unnamed protein product [Protopolystoma xenopodis]